MPIFHYTDRQRELEKLIHAEGFATQMEVPVDRFCIDILVPEFDNLVIELNGPQHYKKATERREDIIRSYGFKNFLYIPISFTDEEFLQALNKKLKEIYGEGLKRYSK